MATELDIESIPLARTVFRFPSWFELPGFYCSLTETCSLSLSRTSLILDIRIMINWHLSKQVIRSPLSSDHIAGSSLDDMIFEFGLFGSQLTLTQDFNQSINFSCIQIFLVLLFCAVLDSSNSKQNAKQHKQKHHRKVTKRKSKFSIILG